MTDSQYVSRLKSWQIPHLKNFTIIINPHQLHQWVDFTVASFEIIQFVYLFIVWDATEHMWASEDNLGGEHWFTASTMQPYTLS